MPIVHANAKINLFLQVLGKRPDGYHEIVSLFQEISLSDTLTFTQRSDEVVSLSCPGVTSEENTIKRAAELLKPHARAFCGVDIVVEKKIPMGAGLGGGSSDAAATLTALSDLWDVALSSEELASLAAQIGSDVPFFLHGKACLVRGRGEIVQPVRTPPLDGGLLILSPPLHVSTARVYESMDLPPGPMASEDTALGSFLARKGPLPVRNDLYEAAVGLYPEVGKIADLIASTHPRSSMMSGSGAAFWAIYDPANLDDAVRRLTNAGQISIVEPVR